MSWQVRVAPLMVLALLTGCAASTAAEHRVSSAANVDQLGDRLAPGDTIILSDGEWKDQSLHLRGRGTQDRPITYRAQTPGKVILSGASTITIDGEWVVLSGVQVTGKADADAIVINGSHCRLTDCAVVGGDYKFYVHVFGRENRVDHCYLAEKKSEQPTMQLEVPEKDSPPRHQIDHNHFGHRPPLGKNGGESMRVGYSYQSMNNGGNVVEHNLYHECDGEIEIISNKSCENVYRFNTFLDCDGMFTLRHGNRCHVESNFFIGHHKHGSGGIRVIGEDHTIVNNYIDGVEKGAFWITSGIVNSELKGYFRAMNCLIAFNTVVDCKGPLIDLEAGMGTSNRTLQPKDITIANNLFALLTGEKLTKGNESESYKWLGDILSGAGSDATHPGIKFVADAGLTRGEDGLWRITDQSPARGATEGNFPQVTHDIDDQPRSGKLDVGCDQLSDAPITNRPLTPADVGPAWMKSR